MDLGTPECRSFGCEHDGCESARSDILIPEEITMTQYRSTESAGQTTDSKAPTSSYIFMDFGGPKAHGNSARVPLGARVESALDPPNRPARGPTAGRGARPTWLHRLWWAVGPRERSEFHKSPKIPGEIRMSEGRSNGLCRTYGEGHWGQLLKFPKEGAPEPLAQKAESAFREGSRGLGVGFGVGFGVGIDIGTSPRMWGAGGSPPGAWDRQA